MNGHLVDSDERLLRAGQSFESETGSLERELFQVLTQAFLSDARPVFLYPLSHETCIIFFCDASVIIFTLKMNDLRF